MSEFDWMGLWRGAHAAACVGDADNDAAADYLRDRVTAAFVERARVTEAMERAVDQRDTAIDSIRAALERADAAEAKVARSTKGISNSDTLSAKQIEQGARNG